MARRHKLNQTQVESMMDLYNTGTKLSTLTSIYSISPRSFYRYKKAYISGVIIYKDYYPTHLITSLITQYKEGTSIKSLALLYNKSTKTIIRIIKTKQEIVRHPSKHTVYKELLFKYYRNQEVKKWLERSNVKQQLGIMSGLLSEQQINNYTLYDTKEYNDNWI